MRQENDIFVGDIGTEVILDTKEDITDAISVTIQVRQPNGTSVTWPASLEETTAIKHIADSDTFIMAGNLKLQAKVVTPHGSWLGETVKLQVKRPFG